MKYRRNILCIDLKSFFAACECVDKNLDMFTTPLVVADPKRGSGAITLAVTPYLKNKGVKSRGRIYEIPKNIKYIISKPRMSLYIKKSTEVINVYLDFVAKEDLHAYSIDEAFLDVTDYLKLYKKSDYELAKEILLTIKNKTGLYASCGIGSNVFLAKVAMDIEAKNSDDFIAKWTYEDIPNKLWPITPLSKVWGIGSRIEKRLNALGIKNIGELAHFPKNKLIDEFGIIGEELSNHANGIDYSKISDWKLPPKEKSISHSQILFKDYNQNNIKIIIVEMIEVLTARLRSSNKQTQVVSLGIGYSKTVGGGFHHSIKLDQPADNNYILKEICFSIFDNYYNNLPIRKVTISFGRLCDKKAVQLNLFENVEKIYQQDQLNHTIDVIKNKYGKNSILKGTNLLKDSTIRERNKKVGGHSE